MKLRAIIIISFIVGITLLTLSIFKVGNLKLAYNMENFFNPNDENVKFYHSFKEEYENENDYVLIAISNHKGLNDLDFWKKIEELTTQLKSDSNVIEVISPSEASRSVKLPFVGVVKVPIVDVETSSDSMSVYRRAKKIDDFYSTLFSLDKETIKIILRLKPNFSQKAGIKWIKNLKESLTKYDFNEFKLAGRLVTQSYYLKTMNYEMKWFSLLSLMILLLCLFILLRNFLYGFLSVLVLLSTIICTLGFISFLDYEMDLIMIIIPAILLIIGTSSFIHVFSEFNLKLKNSSSISNAISNTWNELGTPILLNLITTASGFAALGVIPIIPIQKFGLFTAFGILILPVFLIGFSGVGVLVFKPKYKKVTLRKWNILGHSKVAKLGRILLIIVSILGLIVTPLNKISNKFLEDLNENSELKKSLSFFEQKFDGIRPLEIVLDIPQEKVLEDVDMLFALKKIEEDIKNIYQIKNIHSILEVVRSVNYGLNAGNSTFYSLPKDSLELSNIVRTINKYKTFEHLGLPAKTSSLRFSGRIRDIGSDKIVEMNSRLQNSFKKEFPNQEIKFTGMAHLIDETNRSLSGSLIKGLLLGLIIALLSVLVITKSISISLISLFPNIIPLLFISFLFWISGTHINIGTAIVFSIVFGLSVDDTMHFIYRFNKYRKGNDIPQAIELTIRHLTRPMIQTSIILGAGFLIFGFSSFHSISILGISVSSALVIALFADLLLLPKLMLLLKK